MGVSKTVIENTHWLFSKDNPFDMFIVQPPDRPKFRGSQ